jgi:malate dehydrogenase (oxaloacetate-decarboxylating)(NADP+)
MTIVFTRKGPLFLADTGLNIQPNHKELAEIARLAAEQVRAFDIEPRVAMLSFSSFGGTPHPRADMVRRAVELARERSPELIIDGEMRVDCALDPLVQAKYPDCRLGGKPANVLIPPSLESANIAFNLLRTLGDMPVVGPITLGLAKPAHMLQPHSKGVKDMVHLTAIASLSPVPEQRPVLLHI